MSKAKLDTIRALAQRDAIRALAQRDANNTGKTMVIYNLNRYSPLYVYRLYKPNAEYAPDFIEKIEPQPNWALLDTDHD